MENFVHRANSIHGAAGDLGNSINDKHQNASLESHEKHYLISAMWADIVYWMAATNTKIHKTIKMAEAKLAWVAWHIFGGASFLLWLIPPKILSILDINVTAIPQPFQGAIYIIAILYGVSMLWRSFHKGYHMHLRNREYKHEIRRKYDKRHQSPRA